MTVTYHTDFEQGSVEWLKQRCGLLTASQMSLIITPTLKIAANDKERQHLFELLAQRITNHVEPQYVGGDMLRGETEEILARELYSDKVQPVTQCGFITNNLLGFKVGYSPDGLVGDEGQIEIKSRRQKYQMQTIVDGVLPVEFMLQIQAGMFVSERQWTDFISYSNGMPMFVLRVFPDKRVHEAIVDASCAFEVRLAAARKKYEYNSSHLLTTKRMEYEDLAV
jgi:hypothetical protein